jgi:hypothetical protein
VAGRPLSRLRRHRRISGMGREGYPPMETILSVRVARQIDSG